MRQIITIGENAIDHEAGKLLSLHSHGCKGPQSIDLVRFISARVRQTDPQEFGGSYVIVRLYGVGWLRYIRDSYVEIFYTHHDDAMKDYNKLIDAVNEWRTGKEA